ncbi:MAG: hypothetical protein PHX44_04015 [Sulfurimonas sp.]|uniref:hypothetical protein n=1 Tax=Sulfurimonas sp. TaxID=2022749 RepID=UPI00261966DD|nr:hypothetical protein [Sulfurimonas sp.]MDD2652197.1 hypothetical protein [Sulfurimonas sp.]MDD3450520.1 hypothetical protein [Sulfurimonas sp.]
MKNEDLKLLVQIAKSKIDKDDETFEQIEMFVVSKHGADVFDNIKDEIIEHIERRKLIKEKNKRFWMLISNPQKWGDDIPEYAFNETILNLNDEEIIQWSINKNTDISLQMKEGERGIIKVSEDKRTIQQRTDENENIVPLVESGIYGIFEIVKDDENFVTFEDEYGDFYVNIKVIDNFYKKSKQISKQQAVEILGEDIFNSMQSRSIERKQFEAIESVVK